MMMKLKKPANTTKRAISHAERKAGMEAMSQAMLKTKSAKVRKVHKARKI